MQGHFLKCAFPPSTPPHPPTSVSFPPYPNKSCFSGKRAQPLLHLLQISLLHGSRLLTYQHACLQTAPWLHPHGMQGDRVCSKQNSVTSPKHTSQTFTQKPARDKEQALPHVNTSGPTSKREMGLVQIHFHLVFSFSVLNILIF